MIMGTKITKGADTCGIACGHINLVTSRENIQQPDKIRTHFQARGTPIPNTPIGHPTLTPNPAAIMRRHQEPGGHIAAGQRQPGTAARPALAQLRCYSRTITNMNGRTDRSTHFLSVLLPQLRSAAAAEELPPGGGWGHHYDFYHPSTEVPLYNTCKQKLLDGEKVYSCPIDRLNVEGYLEAR